METRTFRTYVQMLDWLKAHGMETDSRMFGTLWKDEKPVGSFRRVLNVTVYEVHLREDALTRPEEPDG